MKLLILVADYPDNDHIILMYVHTRNKYYISKGMDVTVLNFSCAQAYAYDGVKVISIDDYNNGHVNYDLLIVHAPNIRNHYLFLKKNCGKFNKIVLFFHGHEVLKIRETYSPPYDFAERSSLRSSIVQDIYDTFKLFIWRHYLPKLRKKVTFVFVSNWMRNRFERYTKLNTDKFDTRIIPNSIGKTFETNSYNTTSYKKYDYITIRSNLDGSKYCIDFINELAKNNGKKRFLIIGQGDFFKFRDKAPNIYLINRSMPHDELLGYINESRAALMPTRLDAQGVMMCELATYGIPVITSNIDICQELSNYFENWIMIRNDEIIDLSDFDERISKMYSLEKSTLFCTSNTVGKEVELFIRLMN